MIINKQTYYNFFLRNNCLGKNIGFKKNSFILKITEDKVSSNLYKTLNSVTNLLNKLPVLEYKSINSIKLDGKEILLYGNKSEYIKFRNFEIITDIRESALKSDKYTIIYFILKMYYYKKDFFGNGIILVSSYYPIGNYYTNYFYNNEDDFNYINNLNQCIKESLKCIIGNFPNI